MMKSKLLTKALEQKLRAAEEYLKLVRNHTRQHRHNTKACCFNAYAKKACKIGG